MNASRDVEHRVNTSAGAKPVRLRMGLFVRGDMVCNVSSDILGSRQSVSLAVFVLMNPKGGNGYSIEVQSLSDDAAAGVNSDGDTNRLKHLAAWEFLIS